MLIGLDSLEIHHLYLAIRLSPSSLAFYSYIFFLFVTYLFFVVMIFYLYIHCVFILSFFHSFHRIYFINIYTLCIFEFCRITHPYRSIFLFLFRTYTFNYGADLY